MQIERTSRSKLMTSLFPGLADQRTVYSLWADKITECFQIECRSEEVNYGLFARLFQTLKAGRSYCVSILLTEDIPIEVMEALYPLCSEAVLDFIVSTGGKTDSVQINLAFLTDKL